MIVPVVNVGVIGMGVYQFLMTVGVRMRLAPILRKIMIVPVMLVTNVGMLMRHFLMRVPLGDMQADLRAHQSRNVRKIDRSVLGGCNVVRTVRPIARYIDVRVVDQFPASPPAVPTGL
jgi:hypothetical protein